MLALLAPLLVYAAVLGLHLALPGRWIDGYVLDPATGRPLRYRLNGLRVLFASVAVYAGACVSGWIAWDVLYLHRWESVAGACVIGVVFTLWIVLSAPPNKNLLADLYLGRLAEPPVALRARRRQDVPVPGRRRHAGAEPAFVHGPPL